MMDLYCRWCRFSIVLAPLLGADRWIHVIDGREECGDGSGMRAQP